MMLVSGACRRCSAAERRKSQGCYYRESGTMCLVRMAYYYHLLVFLF